jgi:hypothetical protein
VALIRQLASDNACSASVSRSSTTIRGTTIPGTIITPLVPLAAIAAHCRVHAKTKANWMPCRLPMPRSLRRVYKEVVREAAMLSLRTKQQHKGSRSARFSRFVFPTHHTQGKEKKCSQPDCAAPRVAKP